MKNKRVCSNPDRTFKLFVGTLFLFFALSFFIVMIIGADLKLTPDTANQPQPPSDLETQAVAAGFGNVGEFNAKLAVLNYDQLKSFFNTPLVKDNIGKIYPKLSEGFTATTGEEVPNLRLGAWMTSEDKKSLMSKLDENYRMNLVNKVLADDSKMSSQEKEILAKERVKAVELSLKEEFKDIRVYGLPKDIQLKIVKGSDGKLKHSLEYIGKDGKSNGEIALNKKIKDIYSDPQEMPQLNSKTNKFVNKDYLMLSVVRDDSSSKNIRTQTLEIGPGLNMNEKMEFSYEGSKKDIEIKAGYGGSRDSWFTLELEKGADGKNNLGINIIDTDPQEYKSLADMGKDIANIPSVLVGDSKSGYLFVQPQGEAGKNGEISFSIDSQGKIAVTDGRARFAVTQDNYDPSKSEDQPLGYSMSAGEGKIVNLDRSTNLVSPEKVVKGSNEITIGKNGIVVNNNNIDLSKEINNADIDKLSNIPVRDVVTINDFSKQLEHKIYAYGTGETRYYDNTGNLYTHTNNNDISQWIQGAAQITARSTEGTVRMTKGSSDNILDMDIEELGQVPVKNGVGTTTDNPAESTTPSTGTSRGIGVNAESGAKGISSEGSTTPVEKAPAKVEINSDSEGWVDAGKIIRDAAAAAATKRGVSEIQGSSSSNSQNSQTSPEKQKAILDALGSGFSASPGTDSSTAPATAKWDDWDKVAGGKQAAQDIQSLYKSGAAISNKPLDPSKPIILYASATNDGQTYCGPCNQMHSAGVMEKLNNDPSMSSVNILKVSPSSQIYRNFGGGNIPAIIIVNQGRASVTRGYQTVDQIRGLLK